MRINDDAIRSLANLTLTTIRNGPFMKPAVIAAHAIGAFTTLMLVFLTGGYGVPVLSFLNVVLYFFNSREKTWDDLRPQIEALVNQKIQDYHLETINSNLVGLIENMSAVQRVYKQFNEAPPQDREREGELLRSHHNAFLMFLRASIPHYQMEKHAVVSLPSFAMAATIQLMMLGDALKNGLSWGYTAKYLRAIRDELNDKTGLGTKVHAVPLPQRGAALPGTGDGIAPRGVNHWVQMQLLSDTIHQGEAEGWSAKLVDTWKHAYSALSVQRREVSSAAAAEALDYPTYVRRTYEHGRTLVQPYKSDLGVGPGRLVAAAMRAYADYDALMMMHAMSYAEYWPYLTGEFKVPDSVLKNLDREIYSGPYGRWADRVPWDATQPPPPTARIGNITSLVVRAERSIDGFRLASGGHWGSPYGSQTDGAAYRIDLAPDEPIENVELTFGQRVGSLAFVSNKAKYGPYGSPKYTKTKPTRWKQLILYNFTLGLSVNRTGYGLSSVHCTRWSPHRPSGCEGMFFGFRPLYFVDDEYEPVQNNTLDPFAALADLDLI